MPLYKITNRVTHESHQVEAPYAELACEKLGWMIGFCHVQPGHEQPAFKKQKKIPK